MSLVYYDLATTGPLNPHDPPEIICITYILSRRGELHQSESNTLYITPQGAIHPAATRLHGLYKDQFGRLRNRRHQIIDNTNNPTWTLNDALVQFISWLAHKNCRYLVSFRLLNAL